MTESEQMLLDLNQQLLNSIVEGDWATYSKLCHESLTCFEPETRGHLVSGLEFHKYYFDLAGSGAKRQATMASPHVRFLGPQAAVICYGRLTQHLDSQGMAQTSRVEETRVWQNLDGRWQHVHFHRSA